ncbi:transcriptional regulator, MarR family [Kribbella flavida DSM 17836]|uniref:Transcriptional regulator, MarR family n=1 Tax=Kribbella flavida (strain DSM 17836 / JCM 10339 / NBRC 14399) TaxID=479435 RepID=D2PPG6_KRIFD|nr:MarR family winged helix-turn-helix transcriptional regulator [Kribbella flavida]ADB30928.1 transcriptional regulator, MarR family [Kribbella flavida DSM 17836]
MTLPSSSEPDSVLPEQTTEPGKELRWDPDAPASGGDVLIALRFADRAARKAIGDELAGTGVHTGQEIVLAKLLHFGSLPVARLAKVLDVEVPTATRTTQRMEAAGLVRRVKNTTTDARQVTIELTEQGAEVARTVQRLHAQAGDRALAGISADDRRLLRNLLWTITGTIDELPGRPPNDGQDEVTE